MNHSFIYFCYISLSLSLIARNWVWWLLICLWCARWLCTVIWNLLINVNSERWFLLRKVLLAKILSVVCHCLLRGAMNVRKIFQFCTGPKIFGIIVSYVACHVRTRYIYIDNWKKLIIIIKRFRIRIIRRYYSS